MRHTLGAGALALVAVGCCAGLPLLATASVSAAAIALIGGITAGAIVLAVGLVLVVIRVRAARRSACAPNRSVAKEA